MFVLNFKVAPSKKLAVFFSAASLLTAIVCIICMMSVQNSFPDTATCDEVGSYSLTFQKEDDGAGFLEQFGLSVDKLVDNSEVKIPSEFNDTYNEYNKLQNEIGLDLEKFRGKTAQKITCRLKDSSTQFAVLLVYKEKVIGAHLTNGEYGSKNLPLV